MSIFHFLLSLPQYLIYKMHIPFYGLTNLFDKYKSHFDGIASKVLASGQYFDEKTIFSFEETLARNCQRKYAITVGSCTDALFFALISLGVSQGDKVVVPAVSFIATVTPVLRAGAIPVFADIDPTNGLICPLHLEKLLQQHEIKAVIVVDLYGNMIDPAMVNKMELTYNVPFIEDAAQSIGCERDNRVAGSLGKVSCLSFDPTKVIHAFGGGGAVLTDDDEICNTIKQLRYHGKEENDYVTLGYNSRMNTMQIELLRLQMDMLEEIINDRNKTVERFKALINQSKTASVIPICNSITNFHKLVIRSSNRDEIKKFLADKGIQTFIHYPKPLFDYSLFNNYTFVAEDIKIAYVFCNEVLSLPLYTFMSEKSKNYICEVLQQINAV